MIQRCLLLLCGLLFATGVCAQDFRQSFDYYEGNTAYVFADTANIRSMPATTSATEDRVYAGQALKVLGKASEPEERSGKSCAWYEVSYRSEGREKTGFIWGGLLAVGAISGDSLLFMYSFRYPSQSDQPVVTDVKAMKGLQMKARSFFQFEGIESTNTHAELWMKSRSFKEFRGLLQILLSGAACGVPTYRQYIGWTGEKLVLLPQIYSVSDAGVYYQHQEFIFPAEKNGIPDILQVWETEESTDENDKTTTRKGLHARYRWVPEKHSFIRL